MGTTSFLHHSGYVNLLLMNTHAQPQTETCAYTIMQRHNYGLQVKTFDINYHIVENYQGRKLAQISRFGGYSLKFSL